jgi:Mn-containing catalase
MTDNKTARSTIAYLIVRDQAHENAYAKALETLGVDWGKTLPIPKTHAERFPEVKKLLDLGLQNKQYSFNLDDLSEAGRIFQGVSPTGDGSILTATEQMPQGVPMTIASERMEEFSPGLDRTCSPCSRRLLRWRWPRCRSSSDRCRPRDRRRLPATTAPG